jgi:hypothetical protein
MRPTTGAVALPTVSAQSITGTVLSSSTTTAPKFVLSCRNDGSALYAVDTAHFVSGSAIALPMTFSCHTGLASISAATDGTATAYTITCGTVALSYSYAPVVTASCDVNSC